MGQQIITVLQQQLEGLSIINLIIISIWACVVVGIALLIQVLHFHKEYTWVTILVTLLLTIYMCSLFFITLGNREIGSRDDIRWIPFNTLMQEDGKPNATAWILAGFNVILLVPFGTMITVLMHKLKNLRCFVYVTVLSFTLSLTIEITQRVTKLGYFETEDIILNTLGGMIGWFFGTLIILGVRKFQDRGNSFYL